jgi:hypothetical protein
MRPWKVSLLALLPLSLTGCGLARYVTFESLAYRGPIATIPMVPMGPMDPPSADEQTRADRDLQTHKDSLGCQNLARYAEHGHPDRGISGRFGRGPEAHTNAYVWCMGYLRGYRCVNRSENRFCQEGWVHPTASQTQYLHDRVACERARPRASRSIVEARFNECMTASGYQKDVGDTSPEPSTPNDQQQELIRAAKTHYCRQLHPSDNAAYEACLAE